MKIREVLRDNRGIALVTALVVMLLLLALGVAAMQMSELGYLSISSETKYQIANWAAEYAVQEGIRVTAANNSCTASSGTGSAGRGTYKYYREPSSNLCFVYGIGTFAGAKVVKTAVIPRQLTSEMGTLTLRNGGVLNFGGSSSIVNCDPECRTPAVLYGTNLRLDVNSINDDITCPNNPRGLYGSPHAVEDIEGDACNTSNGNCSSSIQMPDRIPIVFEADDWSELINRLSNIYSPSNYNLDVNNLSISSRPPEPSIPPDPPSTCECTNAGNFNLTAGTTSCAGIANFATCSSIEFTESSGTLTINGIPGNISNVVSKKNITIVGSLNNKRVFFNGNATDGTVTITIDGNITITNSFLYTSSGNISITRGTINDSIIVNLNNTGDVLFDGGILNRNLLITKDLFKVDNNANQTIMTDNKIFAGSITIVKGSGNISGGLLYSRSNTTFSDAVGNTKIGCVNFNQDPTLSEICAADCNPVLFIIGGDLISQGRGGVKIFGIVFVNGIITYSGNGDFSVTGSVISNSTTGISSFAGTGNANIRFSSCIINYVKNDHSIVKRPVCGGGGSRASYIQNTKITVY